MKGVQPVPCTAHDKLSPAALQLMQSQTMSGHATLVRALQQALAYIKCCSAATAAAAEAALKHCLRLRHSLRLLPCLQGVLPYLMLRRNCSRPV